LDVGIKHQHTHPAFPAHIIRDGDAELLMNRTMRNDGPPGWKVYVGFQPCEPRHRYRRGANLV
jgi:hypothetical protein